MGPAHRILRKGALSHQRSRSHRGHTLPHGSTRTQTKRPGGFHRPKKQGVRGHESQTTSEPAYDPVTQHPPRNPRRSPGA